MMGSSGLSEFVGVGVSDFDFSAVDVCVYHGGCRDGFCCAYLVWSILGRKGVRDIDFIGLSPSSVVDDGLLVRFSGKRVLIVDLSFSRDDLLRVSEVASGLLLVDHHVSALDALVGLPFVVFDLAECGASLLWRVLIGFMLERGLVRSSVAVDVLPVLVRFVRDRDLYLWELDKSREVNAFIGSLRFEFDDWLKADLLLGNPGTADSVASQGAVIFDTESRLVRSVAKDASLVDLFVGPGSGSSGVVPCRVVCCGVGGLISDVGNEVLVLFSDVDVVCVFSVFADGGCVFSLRSREGFDASVIAVAWGGGGHVKACGFKGFIDQLPWDC